MATVLDRMLDLLERSDQLADARADKLRAQSRASYHRKKTKTPRTYKKHGKEQGLEASRQLAAMQRAYAIIKQGWVQEEIAVDKAGHSCTADDPEAAAWCLDGAIQKAVYEKAIPGSEVSARRISVICRQILKANNVETSGGLNAIMALANLNDHQLKTQKDALALLEKAIEEQKQIALGRR